MSFNWIHLVGVHTVESPLYGDECGMWTGNMPNVWHPYDGLAINVLLKGQVLDLITPKRDWLTRGRAT